MNRRGFLDSILKAGVGAAILPAAMTYARTWKREKGVLRLVSYWDQTACGARHIGPEYPISFESLKRQLEALRAARERNGWNEDVIEILTDSWARDRILEMTKA